MLALVALVAACTPHPPAAAPAPPDVVALERQMFERVNKDRRAWGAPPLAYDERLAEVARAHSVDMRDQGFFGHRSPSTGVVDDRLRRAGYLATEMRENLAIAADIDRAEDNLLKSPGHRANILATSVTHLGVGVVRGSADGDPEQLTVTQIFARPVAAEPAAAVERGVVQRLAAVRAAKGIAPLRRHQVLDMLARDHVGRLPTADAGAALAGVGDAIGRALSGTPGHGLTSLDLSAQVVFNAEEVTIPAAALSPEVRAMGLASEDTRDADGPRVKVLILLAR